MKFLIAIILLISQTFLFAQTKVKTLDLKECISIAQNKSKQAEIVKRNNKSRKLYNEALKAEYYPSLMLQGSLPGYYREINRVPQPDGTSLYRSYSNMNADASLNVIQKIPFFGSTFNISSSISRTEIPGDKRSSTWRTSPIYVGYSQPLFKYNDMYWNLKTSEIQHEADDSRFIEDMEGIALEASSKFFELYMAYMNLKNAELNVAINDSLYILSNGRYNVGKIAENDLLQSELALTNSKNNLSDAKLNYSRNVDELKEYLNLQDYDDFTVVPPTLIPVFEVNLEKAMESALQYSSKFNDYRVREIRAESNLASIESQYSFNATISAAYGFNQSANKLPDAYNKLLDQKRFDIGFSIPLFMWGKGSSEIEAALHQKEITKREIEIERKNFELEIKYQILRIEQQFKQVKLSARADTVASRRFEVAKNRYMIGTIDVNTLFMAQSEKDNAYVSYISALRNFWQSYFNLRKITLYDFEKKQLISYDE